MQTVKVLLRPKEQYNRNKRMENCNWNEGSGFLGDIWINYVKSKEEEYGSSISFMELMNNKHWEMLAISCTHQCNELKEIVMSNQYNFTLLFQSGEGTVTVLHSCFIFSAGAGRDFLFGVQGASATSPFKYVDMDGLCKGAKVKKQDETLLCLPY